MGFLTKHCQMAWQIAVHNCKLIFDGLTDLTQRKLFVSSFQNAAELCFLQLLIDKNDHRVIDKDRMKQRDPTFGPRFSAATDLNLFFSSLSEEELICLHSREYEKLYHFAFEGKSNTETTYKYLKLLGVLRNKETHFHIDDSSYLNMDDFKKLCELMKTLQDLFMENNVIEHLDSEIPLDSDKKYLNYFDKDITTLVSFENLIVNSKTNIEIVDQFPEYKQWDYNDVLPSSGWWFNVYDANDLYSIAHEVFKHHGIGDSEGIMLDLTMNFDEFYRRFVLMNLQKMFVIESYNSISKREDDKVHTPYVIVSKNKK